MKKLYYQQIALLVCITAFLMLLCGPTYATIVYPDSTDWQTSLQGSGTASIEADNPRDGNASLKLTTSGSLNDWAFWSYDGGGTSLGRLNDLKDFSFDWYRTGLSNIATSDVPWQAQTPVIRLYINDHSVLSELVWEQYYSNPSPAVTGTWVNQDLINQNLWQHTFASDGSGTYTLVNGVSPVLSPSNPLLTLSLLQWFTSYYSPEAFVYGFSVGVGSYWPENYVGYVDDIKLSFVDTEDNFNFELPVPEPSSLLLTVFGFVLLTVGRFIWHKKPPNSTY